MFRIVESNPSKNAEPIKAWLAKLGSKRIDETSAPSLAAQRAIICIDLKVLMKNRLPKELRVFKIENNLLMYGKM